MRLNECLTYRVPVGRGRDGRQLPDDPAREDLPVSRIIDIRAAGV